MATLGLDEDELKAIEQLVARLAQLSSSIQSLKLDILKSTALPPHSSMQASTQILQRNLQTVLDCMSENSELFARIAIRPSTNFPGRTQENVLTQLLRKKLEPEVEELVAQGRETARLATPEGIAALQTVWEEARKWTHERIAAYVRDEANDPYTREEREMGIENVRTGLLRALDDESDDEDEDEDDGDEDVDIDVDVDDDDDDGDDDDDDGDDDGGREGRRRKCKRKKPPRGPEPETLLWFAARGDFGVPRNVEYGRKVGAKRGLEGVNIPPQRVEAGLATDPGVQQHDSQHMDDSAGLMP